MKKYEKKLENNNGVSISESVGDIISGIA